MKKSNSILIIALALLIAGLFVGSPLEVLNPLPHRIITIVAGLIILTLFVYLYKITRRIEKKGIKRLAIGIITIVALPYLLIGLYTSLFVLSNRYPMWEDVTIYTNIEGDKVISQFRETSGSIYDYRYRKVLKDFHNGFRISLDWPKNKMQGQWTGYNVAKGTTEVKAF